MRDAPKKTVRIRLSFEMDREVPADWDDEMVLFYFNESSHCMGTEILDEARAIQSDPDECNFCHRAQADLVTRSQGKST